jgi:GntR family transcriptional regulator of vanillate catabolism
MAGAKMTDGAEALADPQNTEPATHTVLTRLREMIVTGEIAPGTRLRAEALATQLEVSRTPVRSALAVLSAEGLVLYSMNRGYTVRAVTLGDIYDSIEVRARIEGLACRLSIEQGWEEEGLQPLDELVARGRAIVDRGEWSEAIEYEWYDCNWIFHRRIHHAANNLVLRHAMRMTILYPVFGDAVRVSPTVAAHVPPRARQIAATVPPHIVQSQADHENLLAAIRAGDGEGAERLMIEHVLRTKARILAIATLR